MKKRTAVMIAILLVACVYAGAALGALPDLDRAEPLLALDGNGTAWLVENRPEGYFLYGVNRSGSILSAQWEAAPPGGRVAVTALAADSSSLYYLEEHTDSGGRTRREILRLDLAEKTTYTLYTGGASALPAITFMAAEGEMLYLAGATATEAQVFSLDPMQEKGEPKQVASLRGSGILTAAWNRDTLYTVTADGRITGYRQGRALPGFDGEACVTALSAGGGTLWYYDDLTMQGYTVQGLSPEMVLAPNRGALQAGAALSTQDMVLLESAGEGMSLLRCSDGTIASQRPRFSLPAFAAALSAVLATPWLWLVVAAGLLLAAVLVLLYAKTVAVKMIAISACGAVLLVSLVTGLLTRQIATGYARERAAEAGMVAAWQSGEAYAGQLQRGEQGVGVNSDLWQVREGFAELSGGPSGPLGASPGAVYPRALQEMLQSAIAGKSAQSGMVQIAGVPWAVYITPYGSEGSFLQVTMVESADLYPLGKSLFYGILGICALIAAAAVTLTAVLVVLRLRPLGEMIDKMQAVADGDYTAEDVSLKDDEIGMVRRSMQEVCLSLAIKEYEANARVSSYERFVPRGIDGLLERASIAEVSCGDIADVSGCVGVVTVGNREISLQLLDNQQYMAFVNWCFGAIHSHTGENNAQLLHSDFDMSAVPLYFAGGAQDGVSYGLQLMGEQENWQGEKSWAPQFFILLHNTEFLYGVAGIEDQAFPFLSSSALTFLTSFSDRLEGLGCKMIITDQYHTLLGERLATRYIGFVASPDGRYTFKLHEVLDTLPDTEKKRRIQYDQKLQEGINLFYKNNFYLARNIFSSILKMCPGDGVARWYTFACERFFNAESSEEICYNLFGAGE